MRKLARTQVRKRRLFAALGAEPYQKSTRRDQREEHWFLARIRRWQTGAGAQSRLDADRLGQFLKELGTQWFLERIHGWRIAVANRQRIDANAMDHVLGKLRAAGLPTALPDYVVLGCEWLFRLRDFDDRDVQRFLDRVRLALESIMGSTEA